jgi:hypothetical protein
MPHLQIHHADRMTMLYPTTGASVVIEDLTPGTTYVVQARDWQPRPKRLE